MKEGRPLKEHLDELNSILMELREIDVKMEDEDLAAPKVEAIISCEFLNLDCVDHLLDRILKMQHK